MTSIYTYIENVPSRMTKENFVACFGGVYEHSPWIAEMAWDQNLNLKVASNSNSAEGLYRILRSTVENAKKEDKIELLRAHPDLAGKLAISGQLSKASATEQTNADLGNCTMEEFETFQNLNARYKEKFGFPFILAVQGYHRSEILEIFKKRIKNRSNVEFEIALEQVHRIAELRLREIK